MKAPTLRICILALALTTVACGDPVGVKKLTPRDQYRQLQGNALTTATPSAAADVLLPPPQPLRDLRRPARAGPGDAPGRRLLVRPQQRRRSLRARRALAP